MEMVMVNWHDWRKRLGLSVGKLCFRLGFIDELTYYDGWLHLNDVAHVHSDENTIILTKGKPR